jgi:hypothetical protein
MPGRSADRPAVSTAPRPPDLRHLIQVPNFLGHRPGVVHRLAGTTPAGQPIAYELTEGWTLLVFLSTSCDGCRELWDAFGDPEHPPAPGDLTTVMVTRGSGLEAPDRVARLCGQASVVMTDDAWSDFGVHAGPFFVLVDGGGARVATEGVAWSVEQIAEAITVARGIE